MADEDATLDRAEIRQWNLLPSDDAEIWTCSPHVEEGDTLFFYWIAPTKAICRVGRAVRDPFWSDALIVDSIRSVGQHQWWVPIGGVIEIEPIPYAKQCAILGEPLVMRGRSGKLVRPEKANDVLAAASVAHADPAWAEDVALARVVGRSDLPAPATMSLAEWRSIPAGLLRHEKEVESHVVEHVACHSGR